MNYKFFIDFSIRKSYRQLICKDAIMSHFATSFGDRMARSNKVIEYSF